MLRWKVSEIPLKKIIVDSRLEKLHLCTEVRFANFLSSGFITDKVVNPPERKLAERTSVH